MAKKSDELIISDLSGGVNDTDSPLSLPEDQCLVAENIEFFYSPLGERRLGADPINIGSSAAPGSRYIWLYRHLPTTDETAAQLWAFSTSSSSLFYKDTSWHTVVPVDAITVTSPYLYQLRGKSFEGKLFIAYKSGVDRLHVYDGTSLRRAGLAQPAAAPTAADSGSVAVTSPGTFYYRVRFTIESGGHILVRSEPSPTRTFTTVGGYDSVLVTRPSLPGEGETHWELEKSTDNVNFYVITQHIPTATTTALDIFTGGLRVGLDPLYDLSEDIGDYTVQASPRFLAIDNDRLLMAGSFEDETLSSRIAWTPVHGDPGVGNSERVPLDTDNFIDLEVYEGGAITDISDSINGAIYVFKYNHIYKMLRTGQRSRAYDAFPVSQQLGALTGSLVEGLDQAGQSCLYFLDPAIGPCRVGPSGIQYCGRDISTLWSTVNHDATQVICTGLYYPAKRQVHWWVATGTSNLPNTHIVFQTDAGRLGQEGIRKGWTTATGRSAAAVSCTMFADNIEDNAARSLTLKPLVGVGTGTFNDTAQILQYDTGNQDNDEDYLATVTTKPYAPSGFLSKFGVRTGAVVAKAASGISILIKLIRNYAVESGSNLTVDLTPPSGSVSYIIKKLDDQKLSELNVLQVTYGDLTSAPSGQWEVHQIALKLRTEDSD